MSGLGFWGEVTAQLQRVAREGRTAADVIGILTDWETYPEVHADVMRNGERRFGPERGFFAGSGGDAQLRDYLRDAGWRVVWSEASYYYVMRAANGDLLTYIEGDVYAGDWGWAVSAADVPNGLTPDGRIATNELLDFECDDCGRMFASLDALSIHLDEHDDDYTRPAT